MNAFGIVQEESIHQLEGKNLVNLVGVIASAGKMPFDQFLHTFFVEVRSRQAAWIQQDLSDELSQRVSIPDSEVKRLVPAEEEPLDSQCG